MNSTRIIHDQPQEYYIENSSSNSNYKYFVFYFFVIKRRSVLNSKFIECRFNKIQESISNSKYSNSVCTLYVEDFVMCRLCKGIDYSWNFSLSKSECLIRVVCRGSLVARIAACLTISSVIATQIQVKQFLRPNIIVIAMHRGYYYAKRGSLININIFLMI